MSEFKHISEIKFYKRPTFNSWADLDEKELEPLLNVVKGKISDIQVIMPDEIKYFDGNSEPYPYDTGVFFNCDGSVIEFDLASRYWDCDVDSFIDPEEEYCAFKLVIDDHRCVGIDFLDSKFNTKGYYSIKFHELSRRSETPRILVTFKGGTSHITVHH
jgi:hypothetical protein